MYRVCSTASLRQEAPQQDDCRPVPGHRRPHSRRLLLPGEAGEALHPSGLAAEGCVRAGCPRDWRRVGYWKIDVFEVARVE